MRLGIHLAALALCLFTITAVGHASPALKSLSDWGTLPTSGNYGFVLNDGVDVQFQSDWTIESGRNATQITGPPDGIGGPNAGVWSGGQWYNIEGLYMDVQQRSGQTYLDWLVISSYGGVDVGSPTGYPTDERNGNNITGTPGVSHWAYRPLPVIAIDINGGTDSEGNPTAYDWGLVLDSSEAADTARSYDATSTLSTSATLYSVTNQSLWINPPTWYVTEFPQCGPSDLDTRTLENTPAAAATSTDSNRMLSSVPVPVANQLGYTMNQWNTDKLYYFWGSMDVGGTGFAPKDGSVIHYSLWCGNDMINDSYGGGGGESIPTPELPISWLLALTGPVTLFLRRRSRK